ncbi:PTS glucose transporter subunit IIA [Alishewanella tabrizica]|uniref:PTS EIIA type-1 domain-containing protein n=1 Tax=Alishewanella tabrizica TaxID=671278 RepID=A0ABQ2WRL3_9ALTE|nr:PTS glucose transporter subunit IIA [Alishewanella tabrizica]GGW68140.1 hypothetical protein GCM10008111_25320 [Alishewanella tabrizica]
MLQTAIIWQQDWKNMQGLVIKSPFTGLVMPANKHPEPLYQQDILPNSLCAKLEHGLIIAPFNTMLSTSRDLGRRLSLMHSSGLILIIDLPVSIRKLQGKGLHWLSKSGQKIAAGSPLLQLDLPFLQLNIGEIFCVASLRVPTKFNTLYSKQAHVQANQDPLFVLPIHQEQS